MIATDFVNTKERDVQKNFIVTNVRFQEYSEWMLLAQTPWRYGNSKWGRLMYLVW